MVGQHDVPERNVVGTAEPVAPIVASQPELRHSCQRFNIPCVRAYPEIATADVDRLTRLQRLDGSSTVSIGHIEPVVQPPGKPIHAMLLVPFG